ncbi:MAG: cytochrome-c peroxidase [Thalassotalea sp.]
MITYQPTFKTKARQLVILLHFSLLFLTIGHVEANTNVNSHVNTATKDNKNIKVKNYPWPQVPYPVENPASEAKRILGKILFWDEQLSSDNSTACGTCHLPAAGGADPRIALAPGFDNQINTKDDILASLGVVSRDHLGQKLNHAIFKHNQQVTSRASQPYFSGLWANSNFWDGRAVSEFIDPQTMEIAIRSGGALENQVLGPLMSEVEMAKQGQLPSEVINKLSHAKPLALATSFPADIAAALINKPSYPALFKNAFGSNSISLKRIAFAIASYERSLIADQTPWDLAINRPVAIENDNSQQTNLGINEQINLGYKENLGFEFFKQSGCAQCHQPPLFTDNKFYNIGIQGRNVDQGRMLISRDKKDLGAMKTPSLRNVGLKKTFMHNGRFSSLEEVIDAYADVPFKLMATKLPDGEKYDFQFTESQRKAMIAFLSNSLTDPRVANETYPFDRPKLRREIPLATSPSDWVTTDFITHLQAKINQAQVVVISWQSEEALPAGYDIEIVRNDGRHYWSTQSPFIDIFTEAGQSYTYGLSIRNSQLESSSVQNIGINTPAQRFFGIAFTSSAPTILLSMLLVILLLTGFGYWHYLSKKKHCRNSA